MMHWVDKRTSDRLCPEVFVRYDCETDCFHFLPRKRGTKPEVQISGLAFSLEVEAFLPSLRADMRNWVQKATQEEWMERRSFL